MLRRGVHEERKKKMDRLRWQAGLLPRRRRWITASLSLVRTRFTLRAKMQHARSARQIGDLSPRNARRRKTMQRFSHLRIHTRSLLFFTADFLSSYFFSSFFFNPSTFFTLESIFSRVTLTKNSEKKTILDIYVVIRGKNRESLAYEIKLTT